MLGEGFVSRSPSSTGRSPARPTATRTAPGNGSHVASGSFMVDAEAPGKGVGRALGEDLIAWAREAGFALIQFNAVVETNAPAVALWKSLGFEIVGTVPGAFEHPSEGLVGLHVMYLEL